MADAGTIYAQMGVNIGNSLSDALDQYHKEHVKYDQQYQLADALSRLAITPQGRITQVDPDNPDKSLQPIMDKKALQSFQTNNHQQMIKNSAAMEAVNRMGTNLMQHAAASAMSSRIQDASLSGQRTKQIMTQEDTMFPLDVEAKKASTAHIKKITEDEGKINVPGFGMMTPSQYSTHVARQERMDVLKKKSEPLLQFENQLQGAYGLGIKDVVDASQPQQFKDATGKTYKGTPFYDINGTQVSAKDAAGHPDQTFIHAGPNNVPIPYFDKKSGLGWQQIVGKAKTMAPQIDKLQKDQADLQNQHAQAQAQQVIAVISQKDPNSLTPEDQAALAKAKAILGQ